MMGVGNGNQAEQWWMCPSRQALRVASLGMTPAQRAVGGRDESSCGGSGCGVKAPPLDL